MSKRQRLSDGDGCVRTLVAHERWVRAVAPLGGGLVASGGGDEVCRVYDVRSGALRQTLAGHGGGVKAIAGVPDAEQPGAACKELLTGSTDGTLKLWDLASGEEKLSMNEHTSGVNCVAVAAPGLAVSGGSDRIVRLWNIDDGKQLAALEGHRDIVRCVAAADRLKCVTGASDSTIRVSSAAAVHPPPSLTPALSPLLSLSLSRSRRGI